MTLPVKTRQEILGRVTKRAQVQVQVQVRAAVLVLITSPLTWIIAGEQALAITVLTCWVLATLAAGDFYLVQQAREELATLKPKLTGDDLALSRARQHIGSSALGRLTKVAIYITI